MGFNPKIAQIKSKRVVVMVEGSTFGKGETVSNGIVTILKESKWHSYGNKRITVKI